MKKQTLLYSGGALLSLFLLTGCGSNDKADGNIVTNGEASMSIELEGRVELDTTRGCQKLFVVHAIDGNGNPIPGLHVSANVIVNSKAVGNATGTIQTTAPITLADIGKNFNTDNVVPGDKLIILPTSARHHTSYLGDWEISKAEGGTLSLVGPAYNLETTDQLSYVVGNGSVYVPGYGIGVVHVEQPDTNGTTSTNDDGYAYFDVIYDLSLIGHSVVVGAHSGDGYRLGAAVQGFLPDCIATEDNPDNNDTDTAVPPSDDNTTDTPCNSGGTCTNGCTNNDTCPNVT